VKIPLCKPIITKDMIEVAIQALQNEKLVLGKSVYKFEEEFAKFIGVKYAVAVNSGTLALLLVYIALNVVNGVKFITLVQHLFSLLIWSNNRGRPLFADIDLNTYTIDPRHVYELLREHKDVKVENLTRPSASRAKAARQTPRVQSVKLLCYFKTLSNIDMKNVNHFQSFCSMTDL